MGLVVRLPRVALVRLQPVREFGDRGPL